MITLDQIVSSNVQMLKNQEAELLKALAFVQKAKQLFESQNGTPVPPAAKRIRSRKPATATVKKPVTIIPKKTTSNPVKPSQVAGKPTRLSKIIAVLKQKNAPITTGDLIQTMFKQQKADKNFPHFRQLVYTTLTQAFKRNIIKRKGDKIQLS